MLSIVLALAACAPAPPPPTDDPDPDPGPGGGGGYENCEPAAAVVINEVSASNVDAVVDEDGDSGDWIELFNADGAAVDLAGWTLTDDDDEPGMWSFPSLVLQPGAHLLVHASEKDRRLVVGSWDTRIAPGHGWRYLEVTGPPDADWFTAGYDDSAWPVGPSGFGWGDGDDATEVAAETVYVRTTFDLTADEATDVAALALHVDYDDAFVAYLNGVEVARAGIGTPGTPPAWDALAPVDHEAEMYAGGGPTPFDLQASVGLLTEGANTLAIEAHQASIGSSDMTLIPYLSLGFASEHEGAPAPELLLSETQLHTNFALKASGEWVGLYDPTGCRADALDPDRMLGDQSYGRQPDGTGELGYFLEPTPGAPNTTESRPGFAPTPVFDPPPGHFPGGATVVVTADSADVRVAFDGWEPVEADPVHTGSIEITTDREATVVRARAWADGLWPSRIATGTWFTIAPRELPMVSLVTDPPNLWDPDTGIYVFGPDYDPAPPFHGANFHEDWERPVHVAEWEPDGRMGFAVDAGIAIHGGHTRQLAQKSLRVELGGRWGDDAIEHEIFPGLGVDAFDRVLLRAAGNDWIGCFSAGCLTGAHLRDGLMHRIAAGEDLDTLAWRASEVWLNGEYWGVYALNERPDASYVAAHHGHEDIDLLELHSKPVEGDDVAWQQTMAWLRTHDLSDPANFAHLETLIDVDELATYLAVEVFYDNGDWPGNNVKWWRPRAPDGRWRWLLYDTDWGLGLYGAQPSNDALAAALDPAGPAWPNPPWSTELFRLLMDAPAFRERFVNRYADYLNTIFLPHRMQDTLYAMADELAPAIPRQVDRWGTWSEDGTLLGSVGEDDWAEEIAWIDSWMALRPGYARDHVVANLGLSGTWSLTLDADPPGAGTFQLAAVEVDGPFEGVYFRDVPVTITAVPAPGWTFAGWSDPTLPSTPTITVDPDAALDLVARFE